MTIHLRVLLLIISPYLATSAFAASLPVDDFEAISEWLDNPDGGNPPVRQLNAKYVKAGKFSMKVIYQDKEPHWGNIQRAVRMPPEAVALDFWVYKESSEPQAAMHIWFFEEDGDGWVQQVLFDGKPLGMLPKGWHRAQVPIGGFSYQPRGNKIKQFLTTSKMLLGFNFGDMVVYIDALKFILREGKIVQEPPRTENLQVNKTDKGSIAILKDDFPGEFGSLKGSATADYLGAVLKKAGYGVTFLKGGDVIDEKILAKENFDLLILPYGASYPAEGKKALVSFLKSGGGFFSTGGYAFDNLLVYADGKWGPVETAVAASELDNRKVPVWINSRFGRPGDALGLDPDQIGVFDPSYPLQQVAFAETNPEQYIVKQKVRLEGKLEGWAACAWVGDNNPVFPTVRARWVPLINAYDKYGRLRGSIGSVVHHYAGSYAGSSWAFFGVTNRDVFGERKDERPELKAGRGETKDEGRRTKEAMAKVFLEIMESLLSKTFLHNLETEFACYRQGEEVNISAKVSNFGAQPENISWRVQIFADLKADKPAFEKSLRVPEILTPKASKDIFVTWSPRKFASDFYLVRLQLFKNGIPVDRMETGFVIWTEKIVKSGFPLKFKDNYFRAGERPIFLCGTNQTGMMYYSANENPLIWERDFAQMQDYGLNTLRILHFSPFSAGGYEGRPTNRALDLKNRPEKLIRQMDAIVQLAQKHKIIIFLSLHDWLGVELSDEELKAQRDWNEFWCQRYKKVPGIMYDIENEPSVGLPNAPDVKRAWNDYLSRKYSHMEKLKQAWNLSPPKKPLGDLDVEMGTGNWEDIKTYDANYFKVVLLNRWIKANADGIRSGDPEALFTVGYLPWMAPADKVLGAKHLSFSNMHYYGSLQDFPKQFKITDRRFEGKSFSLGEFGAQEAHDARVHGQSGTQDEPSINRFLRLGHYALGLGASFIENWDWKDFSECVFPWGLNHPGDLVPKKLLKAYRNMSLFFRRFDLKYQEPEVYFLIPDGHRLGGNSEEVTNAILNGLDRLINLNVSFGVLNEFDLHKLPQSAKILFFPIPFCIGDETYFRLKEFAQQEGHYLYISGDISYDENRKRTKTERLGELLGVEFLQENYPNIQYKKSRARKIKMAPEEAEFPHLRPILKEYLGYPCIKVKPVGALSSPIAQLEDGSPVVVIHRHGKGVVFYVADPIELHLSPQITDLYRAFLKLASYELIDSPVHIFELGTRKGDRLYVLFNPDESQPSQRVSLPLKSRGAHKIEIGANKPGALLVSKSGEIKAAETQGELSSEIYGGTWLKTTGHIMVSSLDDAPLPSSKGILILPIEKVELEIATMEPWPNGNCEIGEIRNGKWVTLERIKPKIFKDKISLQIDDLQALNLILLAPGNQIEKYKRKLQNLVAQPESL